MLNNISVSRRMKNQTTNNEDLQPMTVKKLPRILRRKSEHFTEKINNKNTFEVSVIWINTNKYTRKLLRVTAIVTNLSFK